VITVRLRFYEELNDLLPPKIRKRPFERNFLLPTTIKDVIQSCGVPHTEVDLILVNGRSVTFDYQIQDQDRVSIYPVFESLDISSIVRLQERPLRRLRFRVDVPLKTLARRMRLMGLDVLYEENLQSMALVQRVVAEGRVLLTRQRQLLMPNMLQRGYWVHALEPLDQTVEVIKRFDLAQSLKPFARCIPCNGPLHPVPKASVQDCLAPLTKQYYAEFFQCSACGRVYWKGSHYMALREFINQVTERLAQEDVLHESIPRGKEDV